MHVGTLILGSFIILWVFGYIMLILHIRHSAKLNQKDYETEFLMLHNHEAIEQVLANTLPFIPLGFEYRYPENLSSLCTQHPGMKILLLTYTASITVQQFEPRIEVKFIGFRRVDERYRPDRFLPIELIRCTQEFAVIRAGRSNSSYLLTNNGPNFIWTRAVDSRIFYIINKFEHREEIPSYSSLWTENPWEDGPSSNHSSVGRATLDDNVEGHNLHDE